MGYVALTMHLRPSNYTIGHKRLEHVPINSVQTAVEHFRSSLTLDIDDCELTLFFVQL